MKKTLVLILAALLMLTAFPMAAFAAQDIYDDPDVPLVQGLRVTNQHGTWIDLAWDRPTAECGGYWIEKSEDGTNFTKLAETERTVTSALYLIPGKTYWFRIRAYRNFGSFNSEGFYRRYGKFSSPITGSSKLSAPTEFNASSSSYGQAYIKWKSPNGATSVVLERSVNNGPFEVIQTFQPSSWGYYDKNLQPGTAYSYRMRAVWEGEGTKVTSDYTEKITVGTKLNAPGYFAYEDLTSSSVLLDWSGVQDADGYKLERFENGAYSTRYEGAETEFKDAISTSVAKYGYRVTAYKTVNGNKVYGSPSDMVYVIPSLTAPKNVKVTQSSTGVTVSWDAISGAEKYELYRQDRSSKGDGDRVYSGASNSFTDTGVKKGEYYTYIVYAYSSGATSPAGYSRGFTFNGTSSSSSNKPSSKPSNNTANDTTAELSAPENLNVGADRYDTITASWSAVSGARGYELWYSTDGTNFKKMASKNAVTYTKKSLKPNTNYFFKVRAKGKTAYGPYSDTVSVLTPAKPPASVKKIKAASDSHDTVTLKWSKAKGAVGYEVYKSADGNNYQMIGDTAATTFESTDHTAGTGYLYKVRAYSLSGDEKVYSDYSAPAQVTTMPTPPVAPAQVNPMVTGTKNITVTWTPSPGATGYEIWYSVNNQKFVKKNVKAATAFPHKGLKENTTYYYKVRAYAKHGRKTIYGDFTDVITAKTPITPPAAVRSLKVVSNAPNAADLSWASAKSATGYEVWRSIDQVNFTRITGTTTKTWQDTELVKDKVYYYKVRSYRDLGSGLVYGEFSPVMSVHTLAADK